jgi:hypothetical protein
VRPPTRKPPKLKPTRLHVSEVLQWADAHKARHGTWPGKDSGPIPESPWTTWRHVDRALRDGFRGLRGGSSLARLLAKHRGARNRCDLPDLTECQLLKWADQHRARTGNWPRERGDGGIVDAPGETWRNVSAALREGGRGLPGGSSLPRLLESRRGRRNRGRLSRLSVCQILNWADAHHERTGRWPTSLSSRIHGTDGETWRGVDNALIRGARGLAGGTTLADLLAERRPFRNVANLPRLSVALVMRWARLHRGRHGHWPDRKSGAIPGTKETWARIDDDLRRGFRGLPAGLSIARLRPARSRQ